MCNCYSILECCVMFSGVKLSIRSLNLLLLLLCLYIPILYGMMFVVFWISTFMVFAAIFDNKLADRIKYMANTVEKLSVVSYHPVCVFSTSGDTMSTSGGYHEYIGGIS